MFGPLMISGIYSLDLEKRVEIIDKVLEYKGRMVPVFAFTPDTIFAGLKLRA